MSTPPYGPGNPDPERVAAYETYLAQQLNDKDFVVQSVFGTTRDDTFAYTVGLTGRGLPELWCSGLGPDTATAVLGIAGGWLINAGAPLAPGLDLRVPELSVPLRFTALVDAAAAEVSMARMIHPLSVVEVVQVLWPDDEGRFPEHPTYNSERFAQRILPAAKGS